MYPKQILYFSVSQSIEMNYSNLLLVERRFCLTTTVIDNDILTWCSCIYTLTTIDI